MKRIYYGLLLLGALLLVVLSFFASSGYRLPQVTNLPYLEPRWVLTDSNTGSTEQVELPQALKYTGPEVWTLSTPLTYVPKEQEDYPSLFLSMNHMYFRVFLDDSMIYSYEETDTSGLSKSPGNVYTAVPLPGDCTGKQLRIEFTLTLEDGLTYELGDIFLGDYASVMRQAFISDIFHNTMIICILFVGIVLLCLSLVLLRGESARDAYWIGFFAVLFGIYSLSEALFNLYMAANPYLAYLINFIVFAALPLPILMFFKNKTAKKFIVFYKGICALIVCQILVQCILHFSGVRDLRQMLLFTHISYALAFLLILAAVTLSKKEECVNKRFLFTLTLPIISGGILDALMHYVYLGREDSNTAYSQLGVLLTLIISAVYAIRNVLLLYKESINAKAYKELALRDSLTGLLNRAAYTREICDMADDGIPCGTFICICVDINNLKQMNDTKGHLAGDTLILSTAEFLQNFFGSYGKVFRIGGDEFTIFLYDVTPTQLDSMLSTMYMELKICNQTAEVPISFALGYEILEASDDTFKDEHKIEDCLRSADKKMYDNKVKMKNEEQIPNQNTGGR